MTDLDASRRDVLLAMAAAAVAPHPRNGGENGDVDIEMDALTAVAVLIAADEESARTPADAIQTVRNLMGDEPPTDEHELVRAAAEGDTDVADAAASRIADEIIVETER